MCKLTPPLRARGREPQTSEEAPGEEGFSLVELLVAIALFGVVLTAVTGVFIASVKSIGDQRLRTAATRVATDHLETLRSLPFAELDGQAGQTTKITPEGRAFRIDTAVTRIDAATGAPPLSPAIGSVRQITATVSWPPPAFSRQISYTTAIGPDDMGPSATAQAIGTVTMFPNPVTTDAFGRPLADIDVTVPLQGFPVGTLVQLSWSNADGTPGAKTLTNAGGANWGGTIAKEALLAPLGLNGRGEVQFSVSAGALTDIYGLAAQKVALIPPAFTGATIDRNPITVGKPAAGRTCRDANQCQNRLSVTFTVTVAGLDPAQDSVFLQFQLHDGTSQEVPLAPVGGQWQLTIGQKTTKFLPGSGVPFRFTAIRSADGATSAATVRRDVVST